MTPGGLAWRDRSDLGRSSPKRSCLSHGEVDEAVRVLAYLRDQYDAIMDPYVDCGLRDSVALIQSTARSILFASSAVSMPGLRG